MTATKPPEELREATIMAIAKVNGRLHRREEYAVDADAALAAIEARYPGCWETLEAFKAYPTTLPDLTITGDAIRQHQIEQSEKREYAPGGIWSGWPKSSA